MSVQRVFKLAAAVAALAAVGAAHAGADPGAWIVGAKGVWVAPDADRGFENGGGLQLSLGRVISDKWDWEANLVTSDHDAPGNSESLQAGGIDFNRVFYRSQRVNPFLSFGVGLADEMVPLRNDDGFYAAVGGGFVGDLFDYGNGAKLQLRTDAKLRRLIGDSAVGSNLVDYVIGLGFQLTWGGDRPEAPVARAIEVAPPAPPPPPPPPADDDRDGVPNSRDRCPNTAPNTPVDADGCDLDTDRDGVPNTVDRCPNTPAGDKVDAQGCSLRARLKVFFDTNKSTLKSESFEDLDTLVSFMKDAPLVTGVMEGHTDSVGSDAANQGLSQRRADAVKVYLVSKGIASARVQTKGFGETQPEADNATAEGRAQNRRVIFQRTDVK